MDKEQLANSVMKMNCALDLQRKIVGVKFLFGREEYEAADAKRITKKMNYCVMVRLATSGRALKATGDDLACLAGARALGLKEIDASHRSGQNGKRLGLYLDMATAKRARDGMSYCDHDAWGVMVKPLDEFDQEPDVVLLITNAYNVMRVVQAYSYEYGIYSNYKMTGNQAVCSESTAYPYLSNDINVSMLCIGTRHRAGWEDSELAVSFPFNRFGTIVEGLMETINIMDNNQKKEMVEKKLHKNGMRDFKIRYNFNYYDIDRTPEPVRTVPEDNKDSSRRV